MGNLYLVSTPIGNLEDITIRAIKTLFSVDIIASEDTRRTGQLLKSLSEKYSQFVDTSRKPDFISYYDEIEYKKLPILIDKLESGSNIALISDAGTPLISDPGYKLVENALKRHINVMSIPGPSAVLSALISSGLPPQPFLFMGFPPERENDLAACFRNIGKLSQITKMTVIFYVSCHKFMNFLSLYESLFTNRAITIARELTKIHEETWSGTVSDAKNKFRDTKGELVILFRL